MSTTTTPRRAPMSKKEAALIPSLKVIAVTLILNTAVSTASWFATGFFIAGAHPLG
jgi:hypothetical protein